MGGNYKIGLFIVIIFCVLSYASSSSDSELENEHRHSTSNVSSRIDIREKSVRNITLRGHGVAPYYNGVVLKGGSSGGGGGRGGGGGGGRSSGRGKSGGGSGKNPSKPGNRYIGGTGVYITGSGGTGGHKSSGGGCANDICKQSFAWISAMGLVVLVTIFLFIMM
ncbi:hypothetical protein QQ045_007931 [Rhodiola kirilowii]